MYKVRVRVPDMLISRRLGLDTEAGIGFKTC